jgi:hypothetical protein
MDRSLRFRVRAWWLAAAAVGCGCGAAAAIVACITPFPPPVPTLQTCRPTILDTSVVPPEGVLTEWPHDNLFIVPVTYSSCDPTDGFFVNAFIDFDPVFNPFPVTTSGHQNFALDGGAAEIGVSLPQPDSLSCHEIEIIVAHAFNGMALAQHTPDSVGGESVKWFYSARGGINGCPQFDAGDGAFPVDSPGDSLPFVPDGGSE